MIIPIINGGLGNQMFQIAAAYAAATRAGDDFGLNYEMGQAGLNQGRPMSAYRDSIFGCVPETDIIPPNTYTEKRFAYDAIPIESNTKLNGYFQSVKYFDDCEDDIKSLFCIPELTQVDRVALHVRRGDYQHTPTFLPPTRIGYYKNAIAMLGSSYDEIVIYTDSVEQTKKEFSGICDNVVCSGDELEDFYSIAESRCIVGANSSFSWWASYLGVSEISIFPCPWFGPSGPQDYHDIYRDDFKVVSV